jgi:brefeldin A-resistance guanine nucleotide exchange factor 1
VSGIVLIVDKYRDIIRSQTEWNLVFALIRSTMSHPEAARLSFDLISNLVRDGPEKLVTVDNFGGLVTLLDDFATAAGLAAENQQQKGRRAPQPTSSNSLPVDRGRKAVDMLFDLKKSIVPLKESTEFSHNQTWKQLCLPLLVSLARQSSNTSREVRHSAISQLQRILLGPHVIFEENGHAQIEEMFNRVIFPLLDDLLKPQVYQRDPQGMPETRLRASALLCKSFMHFEVRESQSKADFRILWIQILDLLDRLMNIDKGDQLYEAVPESLKNVILVMNAAGILVPPSANDQRDERQRTLWTATQERIERFLPGFLTDIITSPQTSSEVLPPSNINEPPA